MNEQVLEAARQFAAATMEVRRLEEARLNLTTDINASLKKINDQTKELKAPHQAVIDAAAEALSEWRKDPQVQTELARIKHLELEGRQMMKDGDVTALQLIGNQIAELAAVTPKAVPTEGGSVRFRETVSLDIDESRLPDEFFDRVPNERRIRERLKLLGDVRGVTATYRYSPAFYEASDDSIDE